MYFVFSIIAESYFDMRIYINKEIIKEEDKEFL